MYEYIYYSYVMGEMRLKKLGGRVGRALNQFFVLYFLL